MQILRPLARICLPHGWIYNGRRQGHQERRRRLPAMAGSTATFLRARESTANLQRRPRRGAAACCYVAHSPAGGAAPWWRGLVPDVAPWGAAVTCPVVRCAAPRRRPSFCGCGRWRVAMAVCGLGTGQSWWWRWRLSGSSSARCCLSMGGDRELELRWQVCGTAIALFSCLRQLQWWSRLPMVSGCSGDCRSGRKPSPNSFWWNDGGAFGRRPPAEGAILEWQSH
jgi:hypothetical protein